MTPSTDTPAAAQPTRAESPAPGSPPRAGLLGRARAEARVFPRQLWLLAFGFFVLLCGIDMMYPFETTYLHYRLGYSMTTVGLLLGVPALLALPFYILDGAIADRYGRKPSIAIGICTVVGLYFTFAFAGSLWPIAIAVSIEAGFGWALFLTGSNAMIADLVRLERRTEAYAFTRVALNIGMVAGPLIASIVLGLAVGLPPAVHHRRRDLQRLRADRAAALSRDAARGDGGEAGVAARTLLGYAVVLRDARFVVFCTIALLPLYGFGQIWSILPVSRCSASSTSRPRSWSALLIFYAAAGAVLQ